MQPIDIYRRERRQPFESLFSAPGAIFRGTPFWSWNTELDVDQLARQIDVFREMGLGGFHMHSRTGLATEYLGDAFMAAVKASTEKAAADGMLAWLYDEDRWPSGAAGGLVTRDPRYRIRHLLFTPFSYEERGAEEQVFAGARSQRTGNGHLLARYAVRLDDAGCLAEYRQLAEGEEAPAGASCWYAYAETGGASSWFNGQCYADTLNPQAIERFIAVTHERYREVVGEHFGSTIPAIFTDEPQFVHKQTLTFAEEQMDLVIPWTDDLPETYREAYGAELLASLPEIFWELPERRPSLPRYRFHDHVAERFAAAFADTIGAWCEEHGICLTGHMMEEPTLHSQTHALGEAMRSYRSFQLPGIDMLCDAQEFTTAKQAQSAAHQYGCPGVLSELYGVTDWDFPFRGHKSQGDWQAALGVTVRVHHLSWVSMEGEAKRDYPASIAYQSPWWRAYPIVEDHFARVNATLTRGRPIVRVGVIHPIESYWLSWGPGEQTWEERQERESTFQNLTQWLLFGQIDFDFISESLLPEQCPAGAAPLPVGEMAYESIIVPPMRTIRATTLERLEAFADAGGTLIFAGEVPSLVDAEPAERATHLAARSRRVSFSGATLLRELEPRRELDIRAPSGGQHATILHQFRQDGDNRYLFACDSRREGPPCVGTVRVRGHWAVDLLDTSDGSIVPLAGKLRGAWTEFTHVFHAHGHLLARLRPGQPAADGRQPALPLTAGQLEAATTELLAAPVPVTLSEANTLLLDQAEWRLDDGPWQPREELLRLHNLARQERGLEPASGHIVQPWAQTDDVRDLGTLSVRFRFRSDVAISAPKLALERPELADLTVNGRRVPVEPDGWWVDESLRTLPLPDLPAGEQEIVIRYAFNQKMALEWCYLLGDFGVALQGRDARLTAPVRELAWGHITTQGLPFYTGNLTYHCRLRGSGQALTLRAPHVAGTMLGVALDDEPRPPIAYDPNESALGSPAGGEHRLDLTLYGNRFNAFGALHASVRQRWAGPPAWRTQGDAWSYEYNLRPLGIQQAPRIYHREE